MIEESAKNYQKKLLSGLKKAGIQVNLWQGSTLNRGLSIAFRAGLRMKRGDDDSLFRLKPLYIRRTNAELTWEKKMKVEKDSGDKD